MGILIQCRMSLKYNNTPTKKGHFRNFYKIKKNHIQYVKVKYRKKNPKLLMIYEIYIVKNNNKKYIHKTKIFNCKNHIFQSYLFSDL